MTEADDSQEHSSEYLQHLRKKPRNEATVSHVSVLNNEAEAYKAVVLDIEGTTTPITFVHDVLFPFARKYMEPFLQQHFERTDVQDDLQQLRGLIAEMIHSGAQLNPIPEPKCGKEAVIDGAMQALLALMDADSKSTPLKSLQGKVWRAGYERGDLKGVMFNDVPFALQRWKKYHIPVYIYSSGSVAAQKLIFGYSNFGDLTSFLDGHFDTQIGGKRDSSSYSSIAASVGLPANKILFATDILQEAEAASQAGCVTSSDLTDILALVVWC